MKNSDKEYIAPDNHIWICFACGKRATDRRGDKNSLWDESCFFNAVLVDLDKYRLIETEDGNVCEIVEKSKDKTIKNATIKEVLS